VREVLGIDPFPLGPQPVDRRMHVKDAHHIEVPRTLDDLCQSDRLALIVYDMQVGILNQLGDGGRAVLAKVLEVLDAARTAGLPVFFLRHLSLPRALMGTFQLRQAMAWQRVQDPDKVQPWFVRDSPGFALAPELRVRPEEAVFDKITFSAFEGTPLAIALRDLNVNAFAIVGVATEIGIEPTVRHGGDLGLIPVVVTDACGTGHAEEGERALACLRYMGDALFTTSAEFGAALLRGAMPASNTKSS
jgi:biuret amidohydrolase